MATASVSLLSAVTKLHVWAPRWMTFCSYHPILDRGFRTTHSTSLRFTRVSAFKMLDQLRLVHKS